MPTRQTAATRARTTAAKTAARTAATTAATAAAVPATGAAADAGPAVRYRAYCSVKPAPERSFGSGVSAGRRAAISSLSNKWVNGTVLSYYFFDKPTDGERVRLANGTTPFRSWVGGEPQKQIVRQAFAAWKALGIGLDFKEVAAREQAMVRIGFMPGDGSWSYVGRGILDVGTGERTMNFGWNLVGDPDTAIHEIGHTLGFEHEHQNPFAGIVWDEDRVYASLAAPPNNWSRETTYHNIIRKLETGSVAGTDWDRDSVMHYPFEAGLIKEPPLFRTKPLQPSGGLSPRDRSYVLSLYPPMKPVEKYPELELMRSMPLRLKAGQQLDLRLNCARSRNHEIRTFGAADTVVVLYEDVEGELKYRGGDDDSGEDRNAHLKCRMQRGKRYVLRVRLYHADHEGETAVMWW